MSEPEWLTARGDKVYLRDTRNLILRIVVVAFLAAVLWHTVIAGRP